MKSLLFVPFATLLAFCGCFPEDAPAASGLAPVHVVAAGDTLHGIARRYKCTVPELQQLNNLSSALIQPGQKLLLPVAAPALPPVPAPAPQPAPKKPPVNAPVVPKALPLVSPNPGPKLPPGTRVAPAPRRAALTLEDRIRVQAFLDRAGFAPGKLDGADGTYTRLAAERFRRARNLPAGEPGVAGLLDLAQDELPEAIVRYTIGTADAALVGELPTGPEAQSLLKFLPYRSLAELIGEKFHCEESLLAQLNPGLNLQALAPRQALNVPNVEPFDFNLVTGKLAGGAGKGAQGRLIRVRTGSKQLEVIDARGMILTSFPITIGGEPKDTASRSGVVTGIVPRPVYHYDPVLLADVPPGPSFDLPSGPNNPVGACWIALRMEGEGKNARIGLHGTANPGTIGRAVSHGCIRLANWDVVRLARMVAPGTPVEWVAAGGEGRR